MIVTLGVLLVLIPAGAAEQGPGLRKVGKLQRLWPDGEASLDGGASHLHDTLVVDPVGRRAYALYALQRNGENPCQVVGIRSYDLDTLAPLRFGTVAGRVRRVAAPGYKDIPYALDPGRRLFLPVMNQGAPCRIDSRIISPSGDPGINSERFREIVGIDLGAFDRGEPFEAGRFQVPATQQGQMTQRSLVGIRYFEDKGVGKLLVAFEAPDADPRNYIAIWLADTGAPDPAFVNVTTAPTGAYQLQTCNGRMGNVSQVNLPLWRSTAENAIFTVCQAGQLVIKIKLDSSGAPVGEQVTPAPPVNGPLLVADPQSDRLLAHDGASLWVFDGRAMGFVGTAGMRIQSLGIDETTGRAYALGDHAQGVTSSAQRLVFQGGVFMVDARLTPAPQALVFPDYAYVGYEPIRVDPARGDRPTRIFVRRAGERDSGDEPFCFSYPSGDQDRACPPEDFWLVLEDTVALGRQPTLADLDRNTVDHPEEEGVTGVSFEGTGSAYGSRMLLVGGLRATVRPTDGQAQYEGFVQNLGLEPACWPQVRDLREGWVESATHADVETSAVAYPAWLDPSSRADIEGPATRCGPRSGANAELQRQLDQALGGDDPEDAEDDDTRRTRWGLGRASCVGDDDSEQTDVSGSPYRSAPALLSGTAATECRQSEHSVEAVAQGSTLEVEGVVVSRSSARVEITRPEEGGIRVEAIAEAWGIEVGGALSIGYVKTVATSDAAGRPGTAVTNHIERTVCGIKVGSGQESGCIGDRDQAQELFGNLNDSRAFKGRILLRLPEPDADWAQGTPGGYAAAVTKDEAEALNAQLLYGDIALEVPGLEIVIYKDFAKQVGRQILQLAGVRAVSTYGVFLLPQFGGLPPLPPEPFAGDPFGTTSGGDGGATGLPGFDPAPPLPPSTGAQAESPTTRPVVAVPVGGFLTRPLGEGLLTSLLWFLIGLPIYFAARRRAAARVVS